MYSLLIYIFPLIIFVNFSILIIFVSIVFHLKSILAKNYLMSHLLDTIFNFLLNHVLLFPQQRARLSTSSICSWKQLECKFHVHLYSASDELKLLHLTSVKQGRNEWVHDYI
jgi:hypothetical protein